ncbi:MAG: energy-coupling factor transporter transmembrane protein EcfT [Thaumarchaeota archaeon]|nr:energy-coupling factor transporter transmembrane protein EcfT [Nitrososphaerota archaeon]
MQWIASGFLFVRGYSIIHRMDPRVRLLVALALFGVGLVCKSVTELAVLIAIIFGLSAVARISKRFARSITFTIGLAVFAFLLGYFFERYGFVASTVFALRLFVVISSVSIFFLTTTPDELEHVMRWLRIPTDFVMVFVIAVRFVPVLLLDALQIMDAQRSRGLEFEKGNILRRIRNTIPLLVPLIAVAVTRSLDLAEAMDSRAYGAVKRPTSLYVLKMRPVDYVSFSVTLILTGIGLYAAFFLPLI